MKAMPGEPLSKAHTVLHDRNFDDLAERFQRKIYAGLKGEIRLAVLWRDLDQLVLTSAASPLRILDIGAGFSQIAIRLAKLGHQVVVNDLSEKMLEMARERAQPSAIRPRWPALDPVPEFSMAQSSTDP